MRRRIVLEGALVVKQWMGIRLLILIKLYFILLFQKGLGIKCYYIILFLCFLFYYPYYSSLNVIGKTFD